MSHYRKLKMKFIDKNALVEALCKFPGTTWKKEHIKVYKEPIALRDFHGQPRPEKAEIVIDRKYINSASNDIGFSFNKETNSYDVIVSDYDEMIGFNQNWLDNLGLTYGMEVVTKTCEEAGISTDDIEWVKNTDGSMEATIKVGNTSSQDWNF